MRQKVPFVVVFGLLLGVLAPTSGREAVSRPITQIAAAVEPIQTPQSAASAARMQTRQATPTSQAPQATPTSQAPQAAPTSQASEATPNPEAPRVTRKPKARRTTPKPHAARATPKPQAAEATPTPQAAEATPAPQADEATPAPQAAAPPAAAPQVNCKLSVPANPLSAKGLATPWELFGEGDANTCTMANAANAGAFVQGSILDPATGAISAYDPLVITRGTTPAIVPTPPTLPANAVVGISVGFQGNNLTLVGPGVAQGKCVNGIPGSIFGQVSFCNDVAFFAAARNAGVKAPALGTARDGMPCPTTRDFSVVDQDQSDNVTTNYLLTADGQTAQNTAANRAQLAASKNISNGSDNRLLDSFIDPALGCTPFMLPNLADAGRSMEPTQNSNELHAAAGQAAPIALVPAGDPMVLNDNEPDVAKVNAYRASVDQPAAASLNDASTTTYCQNLLHIGLPRIARDRQLTINQPTVDPAVANNLFNFLAQRFNATFGPNNLNCTGLLGVQNPVTLRQDNGVVVGATINLNPPRANATDADA